MSPTRVRCLKKHGATCAALPFLGPQTPGPSAWQAAWKGRKDAPETSVAGPESPAADTVPGPRQTAPQARSLQPGQNLRDRYRIVRHIGRGAMGEVYEARHARLVGRYAIKILNVDLTQNHTALQRFRREAAIASELRHPNIVQVIDFDETDDGRPYLVMELLDGRDLGALIAEGPLPVERALSLAQQIAAGLSVMHRLGIVHRDLKPANVLVLPASPGETERAKLVDFGLSRRLVPSLAVTHDRMLLGTPQYMAPEQAQGNTDGVGAAADQFAMAAIVYEMLAGRPAFDGELLSVVLYRIVYEPPPPLVDLVPGLSPHIPTAIARALAKNPRDRYSSVTDFVEALRAAGGAGASISRVLTPATSPIDQQAPAGRRRTKWFAMSAGVVVVVGTGLALGGALIPARQRALVIPPFRPTVVVAAPDQTGPKTAAQPSGPPIAVAASAGQQPRARKNPTQSHRPARPAGPRASAPVPEPAVTPPPTASPEPEPTSAAPEAGSADEEPRRNDPAVSDERKGKLIVPHL